MKIKDYYKILPIFNEIVFQNNHLNAYMLKLKNRE